MTNSTEHEELSLCISIITYKILTAEFKVMMASLFAAISAAQEGLSIKSKVVILDNAQEPELLEQLCAPYAEYLELDLFSNKKNIGYGSAHNMSIKHGESDYYLAMNPDIVIRPDCLLKAIQYMEKNPDIVALSPEIRDVEGRFQYLCKRYPSVLDLSLRGFAPRFIKQWFDKRLALYECRNMVNKKLTSEAMLVTGCFMLCRSTALKKAGGFNESFFLYFEDFALSMELRKLGKIVYFPQISIVHYGGHAARKGWLHLKYFTRSAWIFFDLYGWKFF